MIGERTKSFLTCSIGANGLIASADYFAVGQVAAVSEDGFELGKRNGVDLALLTHNWLEVIQFEGGQFNSFRTKLTRFRLELLRLC